MKALYFFTARVVSTRIEDCNNSESTVFLFQLAMKRISKNSDVTALLGWPISPGKIKSYYASTGTVGLKNGYPAWISPGT